MAPSPPKPPDPYKVSDAQTQSNIATARANDALNAKNLNSFWGSTVWNFDPNDPRNVGQKDLISTSQSIQLNPEVQNFLQSQLGLSNASASKQTALLGQLPTGAFDPSSIGDTSSIAKETYDRQYNLLKPQFDDAETKLNTTLADRGIPIGNEVYNNETTRYQQAKNETLNGLAQDADLASTNEYQRRLANALQVRELPYQELASLQGVTPGVQQPGFATQIPSQIAGTDVQGNVWNAYNAQVNASQSSNGLFGSGLGALGSIGGALVGKSSKKYKEDFHPVDGEDVLASFEKIPVKDYKYKQLAQTLFNQPEERTGPMAEDWSKQFGGDGETIDFASVAGNLMAAVKALDERTKNLKSKGE